MFDLFKARAEAVSAEVLRCATAAAALEVVFSVLRREGSAHPGGARAVWHAGPILGRPAAERASTVPGLSFDVTRENTRESRVGVTEFDWAIADTGTLVQDATAPGARLASTLVETHVAVVRTASLVPDLATLLAEVDPRRMRYLAFVTGPSRTADIERVLTIGVHGPKKLVIVAVDQAEEAAP
jgi:L-lactate dehydrogenase complex protein LldG